MRNKNFVLFVFLTMVFSVNIFADTNFTLEITGIEVGKGDIYVDLFSDENGYKRVIPYLSFVLESAASNITHSFDIADGEYVIAVYQDTNNNGEMDTNFFGIPKEPFALSNYRGGIPWNFNRLKYPVNNNSSRITLNMGKD